jgi:hypothetical protein
MFLRCYINFLLIKQRIIGVMKLYLWFDFIHNISNIHALNLDQNYSIINHFKVIDNSLIIHSIYIPVDIVQ